MKDNHLKQYLNKTHFTTRKMTNSDGIITDGTDSVEIKLILRELFMT